MKNWILSLTIFCSLLSYASAQLVFEQEEFTHEADLMDDKTEAVYKFKNVGDTIVTVTNLTASCGCTAPQLEKKVYEPGESGEIKAIFTFGTRTGKQHKRITVQTSGGGDKTYMLSLMTSIPDWIDVQPRVIRWNINEPPSTQSLSVEVPLHDTIKLTLPGDSKNFDVRVEQNSVDKYTFLVTPKDATQRVTEFLRIMATATVDGKTLTRQFGAHCLVR